MTYPKTDMTPNELLAAKLTADGLIVAISGAILLLMLLAFNHAPLIFIDIVWVVTIVGAIFVFTFPLYAIYNLITHGRKLP